ncbi:hypothetical protein LTR47_008942 [Exophiala xenobiotica]|nr:hypothetical protein LTR47_008942 [Exophiala xenobiotica]KAK5244214.1 hypothetical protein LTS06_010167 [Exophiala xenobiotica]KAK5282625.1 hypothetical protein LTR40_003021 [Exophiala xenobiotica]KAK5347583.1 hypothetical protein LTR61_008854 [Exophiala xenobiotica]KAK5362676.1 hypothetical protein LTS03_009994 [Exophiala xenobiotica]
MIDTLGGTKELSPPFPGDSIHPGGSETPIDERINVVSILNETVGKRWAGETCYATSSKILSAAEPLLGQTSAPSGLPGTDEARATASSEENHVFMDPSQHGFCSKSDAFDYLESYLETFHCIFAFVHAKICRVFFEKLYMHGMANVDDANQAAHLGILALGWHSSCCKDQTSDAESTGRSAGTGMELYERAQQLSFLCLGKPSLPSVISLLALTLFQQATRCFEEAWSTFGICVRQAQALGCQYTQFINEAYPLSLAFSTPRHSGVGNVSLPERSPAVNLAEHICFGHIPEYLLRQADHDR